MDTTNIDSAFNNFLGALNTKFDHLRTGVSETGVFNISISGAAATAARLATGAKINNVLFDGSTNINLTSLYDGNSNLLLWGNSASNAVNYFSLTNAAAGNGITLGAIGTDVNVPMTVATKGLGVLTLQGGQNVDLRPFSGQVRIFGPANQGSWTFNIGTTTANRTLNLPTDGDVTLPSGTLVAKDGVNTFSGVTTFSQPLQVKNTFQIGSNAPGSQQSGLYLTEFTSSQGVVNNPVNTVAIAAQTATNRSIALSVDTSGYLWGYVGNPLSGVAVFTSKTKTADTLTSPRALSLGGDISGTVSFDGSSDVTIPGILSNTGVTAGTYNTITVDAKGRAIAGLNNPYLTSNQAITISGDVSGSGAQSINLTLAATGVLAGTYNNVTVDAKGRVVSGSNVVYSGGTGTPTAITAQDVINALGFTPANAANVGNNTGTVTIGTTLVAVGSTVTSLAGLSSIQATSLLGNATSATKLNSASIIAATGDASWSVSFDGSSTASAALSLANVNASPVANSLVRLTVNAKGLVTGTAPASQSDISSALGFSPARSGTNTDILSITGNAATATKLQTSRVLSLTGHAAATLNFDGTADVSAPITLATTGVTPGTYNTVTVDAYGRVTLGTNVAYSTPSTGLSIPGISFAGGYYIFSGPVQATDFEINDGTIVAGPSVASTGLTKDVGGNFIFTNKIVAPSFRINDGSISTAGATATLSNVTVDAQGRFIFDAPIVAASFSGGAASQTGTLSLAGVTYNAGVYIFSGPLYGTAFDVNDGSIPQAASVTNSGIGTDSSGNFIVSGPVWATQFTVNDGSYTGGTSALPGVSTDSNGRYIFNGKVVAASFDVNDGSKTATTFSSGTYLLGTHRPEVVRVPVVKSNKLTLDNASMTSISVPVLDTVVDSFSTSQYRMAEYLLFAQSESVFESMRVMVLHDGAQAWLSVSNRITPVTELIDLSVEIVDGTLNVLATPIDVNVAVKATRIALVV